MSNNSASNFCVTSFFYMMRCMVKRWTSASLLKRVWLSGLLTGIWAAVSGCGVSYVPSSDSSDLRSDANTEENLVLYTHTDVIEIVKHKNSNQLRALYYLSRQVYAPLLDEECNKQVSVTVTKEGSKPYGSSIYCSLYGLAYEVFASEKVGAIVLHWAAGRDLKAGDKLTITYQSLDP